MSHKSHTPVEQLDMNVRKKTNEQHNVQHDEQQWNMSIAAMKRLKMLDAKRRQTLLELGIVSTSDMYSLEDGTRIKNEKELNAFIVKMSNTDTPVDIHTRVEDYGEPKFTPMLKLSQG